MKELSERDEQILLITWAQYHNICSKYLIHIPNGGQRHPLVGKMLKKQGLKRGVSDLFLAYPSQGKHGCWIELKKRGVRDSQIPQSQKEWEKLMQDVGYQASFAYGYEEAREILLNYLGEQHEKVQ